MEHLGQTEMYTCRVRNSDKAHPIFPNLTTELFAPTDDPTNSSQSDTLHNHICKEQSKDSFYSEFVLQSIIKILALIWVWQGGGVTYLNEVNKTLFYMYDNRENRTYSFIRKVLYPLQLPLFHLPICQ